MRNFTNTVAAALRWQPSMGWKPLKQLRAAVLALLLGTAVFGSTMRMLSRPAIARRSRYTAHSYFRIPPQSGPSPFEDPEVVSVRENKFRLGLDLGHARLDQADFTDS